MSVDHFGLKLGVSGLPVFRAPSLQGAPVFSVPEGNVLGGLGGCHLFVGCSFDCQLAQLHVPASVWLKYRWNIGYRFHNCWKLQHMQNCSHNYGAVNICRILLCLSEFSPQGTRLAPNFLPPKIGVMTLQF